MQLRKIEENSQIWMKGSWRARREKLQQELLQIEQQAECSAARA